MLVSRRTISFLSCFAIIVAASGLVELVAAGGADGGSNSSSSTSVLGSKMSSSSSNSSSFSFSGSGESGPSSDYVTSLDYLLACVTMGLIICTAYGVHCLQSDFLSESGAIILLGIAVGGLFELIDWLRNDGDMLLNSVKFDRSTFLNILLPIIIFEAGYSLKHGGVMRNLGAVLMLAILGTLISTLIIGVIVFYLSAYVAPEIYNSHSGLFVCFTLGALLSATDPVSVIALLGSRYDLAREPPLLYNLVFGESVLNDAVAIVMFDVFLVYVRQDVTGLSLTLAVLNFAKIFIVSAIIGYIIGLLCALFFRFVSMEEIPHLEVALCLVFGAISYYLCDLLNMSGIMGLFMTARIIGHHASHNMSFHARNTIAFVLKTLASLAECAVFLLLGTSVWAYRHYWNASLCAIVVAACLVSRACVVFPLCGLSNLARKLEVITWRMQVFTWYSGLRGAIAFGLAIILHNTPNNGVPQNVSGLFLSSTLCVILFTVLFMGAFAAKLLKVLGLDVQPPPEEYLSQQSIRESHVHTRFNIEGLPPTSRGLGKFLRYLEKRFIEGLVRRKNRGHGDDGEGFLDEHYGSYGTVPESRGSDPRAESGLRMEDEAARARTASAPVVPERKKSSLTPVYLGQAENTTEIFRRSQSRVGRASSRRTRISTAVVPDSEAGEELSYEYRPLL